MLAFSQYITVASFALSRVKVYACSRFYKRTVDVLQVARHAACQAQRARSRKITQRAQEFLKLHKDAYKAALEAPDEASQAIVQAMDQVYYYAVD
ncbi:hypothetical protein JMJ35_001850 [Cladonia borealis]|uniref:Uncharacterized protein n=1 Tax=Cladonia borealis TaxID=184061 RepID=A0AA39UDS7_9LECA|nr:hypothetical protein JMJ35_001850 [Cladonia borealis]